VKLFEANIVSNKKAGIWQSKFDEKDLVVKMKGKGSTLAPIKLLYTKFVFPAKYT